MRSELLLDVPMVTVVAPVHPLASYKGVIPKSELQKHVQLVLTDRSKLTEGRSYGVYSQNVWRLADMGAKHAFLRAVATVACGFTGSCSMKATWTM